MSTIDYFGSDPLHDLAGYGRDEYYVLHTGQTVTRSSWLSPTGRYGQGIVYLDAKDITGIVATLDGPYLALHTEKPVTTDALGYKVFDKAFSFSYSKSDGSPIPESEYDAVVEVLRQHAFSPSNWSLVDGKFCMNYAEAVQTPEAAPEIEDATLVAPEPVQAQEEAVQPVPEVAPPVPDAQPVAEAAQP